MTVQPESHEDFDDLLPFYAAGTLSAAEAAVFEVHLAACEVCQAALVEWRALAALVSAEAGERVGAALPPLASAIFLTAQDAPYAAQHTDSSLQADSSTPALSRLGLFDLQRDTALPLAGAATQDDSDEEGVAPARYQPALAPRRHPAAQTARRWQGAYSTLAAGLMVALLGSLLLLLNTLTTRENSSLSSAEESAIAAPFTTPQSGANSGILPTSVPLLRPTATSALALVGATPNVSSDLYNPLAAITPSQIEPIISFPARLVQRTRLPQGDASLRLAWSPDGTRLALGGAQGVWVYSTAMLTGRSTLLPDAQNSIISVAFSPDGSTLASINWDSTVRLWDASAGAERAALPGTALWDGMQFSPDGRWLLSGTVDGSIVIVDAQTGALVNRFAVGNTGGYSALLNPDGQRLAVGNYPDNSVRLWDVRSGELLMVLTGHTTEVRRLAFSPDGGTLASGDLRGTVRLWDTATGLQRDVLRQGGTVLGISFNPTGTMLAATMRLSENLHSVWLWDLRSGAQWAIMVNDLALSAPLFSPVEDRLAISSADGRVWMLDVSQANSGLYPLAD